MSQEPRTNFVQALVPRSDEADLPPGSIMSRPSIEGLESAPRTGSEEEEDYLPEIFETYDPDAPRLEARGVAWASNDRSSPCYHHLLVDGGDDLPRRDFELGKAEIELLIAANRYQPKGTNGVIAFGLRGATLRSGEKIEGADRVALADVRPDHRNFRCVLGYYYRDAGKFSAYTGSTVPWVGYMERNTKHNMLPTACYIYRMGTHSYQRPVFPALRLSNDKLEDGAATVLRSTRDHVFDFGDDWDNCVPTDNIHCAYKNDSFSSLGCQTIKGPKEGPGLWRDFQQELHKMQRNDRVDYLLFTGAEVAIAGDLVKAGKGPGDPEVQRRLGRLRVGSEGDDVKRLQLKLGVRDTGYFGPFTKKKLTNLQEASGGRLPADGIYSPASDAALGWNVFSGAPLAGTTAAAGTVAPGAQPPATTPAAPPANMGVASPGTPVIPAKPAAPAAASAAGPADTGVASPYSTAAIPATAAAAVASAAAAARGPAVVSPHMPPMPIPVPGVVSKPAEPAKPADAAVVSPYQPAPAATASGASASAPSAVPAVPPPAAPPVASAATAPAPAKPAPAPAPAGPKPVVSLTVETLRKFAPNGKPEYIQVLGEKGDGVLSRYGINATHRRFCHFMAQVGHECGGFRISEESLTYTTAERIYKIFGPNHSAKVSMAEARTLVRQPEKLAERVYGLGNAKKSRELGNNQPGDGFRYRGRGFLQITGRAAYREAGSRIGVDLESDPDLVGQPLYALLTAADYWNNRKINAPADQDNLERVTKLINGGHNGIDDRRANLRKARGIWAAGGLESMPESLESRGARSLEYGDLKPEVLELKKLLVEAGYSGFRMDEDFSRATHMAVVRFKMDHGLPGDGIVDEETWEILRSAAKAGRPAVAPAGPAQKPSDRIAGPIRRSGRAVWMFAFLLLLLSVAVLALRVMEGGGLVPRDPGELIAVGFPLVAALISLVIMVLGSGVVQKSRLATTAEPRPALESAEPEAEEGIRPEVNLEGVA